MKLIKSKDFKGQWELWQEDGIDCVLLSEEELLNLKKELNEKTSSYKTI